jgi:subtilisin family serine protease
MATVIDKKEMCSVDLKNFKSIQGIEGRTLFERYKLAEQSIIKKYIDSKYQDFLSYPLKENDIITFYGKKYNETPQLLSELGGEALSKYLKIKDETIDHYNNQIFLLKESGKLSEAQFLEHAIKFVNNQFIYCYDGIIVLGVWGMQLRENVRGDVWEICKNHIIRKAQKIESESPINEDQQVFENLSQVESFEVRFNEGENGKINGTSEFTKFKQEIISENELPKVEPNDGYEFTGWDKNPNNYIVDGDTQFTAQYRKIQPELSLKLPWYLRFWNWLKSLFLGVGCRKWLLWLLILLLLFFLLSWLFRSCKGYHFDGGGTAIGNNDSSWIRDDPRVGNGGGIYDPGNPYTPLPTPPENGNILPPQQGVILPIEENPEVIPGNPSIIGNRINVLMENDDKSITDFAKAFKAKYPDEKYKIVYYDDVVKRLQIQIPKDEREQLKKAIPEQFKPEFELFIFDEVLFEGTFIPNDPALSDPNKSWHLNAINATQAWDITRGSENITVAIVDNGFNLNHPELKSKVVQPYNVWKHSKEIFPQKIDHGTHVAGIALAIANNNIGTSGIAPNCKFMPIQVSDDRGVMTTTSVLDGILYALYQGADVVNVSLGSKFTGINQISENEQKDLIRNHFKEEERLWREVMRIAAKHNSTIVVAAGNENVLAGIDAIQRPELFITVSAVNKSNQNLSKAVFSNYGDFTSISAPGVGIYSTIGSNDYSIMDGTSMAAPIISGAVALMKCINPKITTKQIKCILQSTGLSTQGNIGKLIQLNKALQKVQNAEALDCTPTASTGDVQIKLSWNNYNDLDLICTDPSGETVFFKNRNVSSGGQLEIDMNVEYPDSKNPIENIYWKPGEAVSGTYNVYLLYYRKHETSIDETPYNVKVKYGEKTEDYNGTIKKDDKVIHLGSFTLGSANKSPQNPNMPPANNRRLQLEQEQKRLQQELDRVTKELKRIGNSR